jgi:hypothetical protein
MANLIRTIKLTIYWGIGAAALVGLLVYNCFLAKALHTSVFLTILAGFGTTVIELIIIIGIVVLLTWLKGEL